MPTEMVGGEVNTGTPTFTTGQHVPLQMDANGNLKTTGSGGGGGSSSIKLQTLTATFSITGAQSGGTVIPVVSPAGAVLDNTGYGKVPVQVLAQGTGTPTFSLFMSSDASGTSISNSQYLRRTDT